MAHVETRHIHLDSLILHHTEGLEINSLDKKKLKKKNCLKHMHTCINATREREREIQESQEKHMQPCISVHQTSEKNKDEK